MGCGCGKASTASPRGETIGFYVTLPDGTLLPPGVNPDDPSAGEPPYFSIYEARVQVTTYGGGTVRRLKRTNATTETVTPSNVTPLRRPAAS